MDNGTGQKVELAVNGITLRGMLHIPTESTRKNAILFLHGWTGRPNNRAAAMLARSGFYAMTISMAGHNDSDGDIKKLSRKEALDEALAAYDFLRSNIPAETGIVIVGNSFGGYIAALVAMYRPVSAISLRVPANYQEKGFDEPQWGQGHGNPDVDKWRAEPVKYSDSQALQSVHDFAGPIQIIEAEKDEVVVSQVVANYKNAASDSAQLQYLLMKDWPHSLGDDERRNQQFQKLLLDWLLTIVET
jgi:esterase/lipase